MAPLKINTFYAHKLCNNMMFVNNKEKYHGNQSMQVQTTAYIHALFITTRLMLVMTYGLHHSAEPPYVLTQQTNIEHPVLHTHAHNTMYQAMYVCTNIAQQLKSLSHCNSVNEIRALSTA